MITLKSPHEIEAMRLAGKITSAARTVAGRLVKPGVTTKEIDKAVYDFITSRGATPSFLNYNGFPASACVSVNDEIIHGIPGHRKLKEGDIVSIDVGAYLTGYFLRLRFMSQLAKSNDASASIRYFVEEQMVATPTVVLFLTGYALVGGGPIADNLRWGFTGVWQSDVWLPIVVVGLLSQGTGVFGALVLLDKRTNVFCVAVNRASSILAGTLATATLGLLGLGAAITGRELIGGGLLVAALLALAWPSIAPLLKRPRRSLSTRTAS